MQKRLVEAETKYNAALHTLRDKQALCDVKGLQIDVCIFHVFCVCFVKCFTNVKKVYNCFAGENQLKNLGWHIMWKMIQTR
jgi:hypothetical protein